jgi:cyclopropane fatty-acyl-phospholipid synthase-like methyltransferase
LVAFEELMQNPYDAIADVWNAEPRGFKARPYVDRVLDRLARGATVLDLGCGSGHPIAKYVVSRGFRVIGVDASERMLEHARAAVERGEFILADMLELRLEKIVDAVIAWDSVFHVDRREHGAVFGRMRSVLRDGGWHLLSAGGTGDPGFTSEMHGQTFYYSGFAPEQTVALLNERGFAVELCEVDDPTSRGHVAIIARALPGARKRAS